MAAMGTCQHMYICVHIYVYVCMWRSLTTQETQSTTCTWAWTCTCTCAPAYTCVHNICISTGHTRGPVDYLYVSEDVRLYVYTCLYMCTPAYTCVRNTCITTGNVVLHEIAPNKWRLPLTTNRATETNKRTKTDRTNKQQNPLPKNISKHISVKQITKEGGHPHPLSWPTPLILHNPLT